MSLNRDDIANSPALDLPRNLRFGLAANQRHHSTRDSICFDWLRASELSIQALGIELHTVGRTYDAILREGLLTDYHGLVRYPYGRDGGLMKLVARITETELEADSLDGAIYLIDPVDPSSIFPEALALKRQCITHKKPFISTMAGAIEWIEVERLHAGLHAHSSADALFDLSQQCAALIAHDALKDIMLDFATQHFEVLSSFAQRVATGTTGKLLNELAWSRGWPTDMPWVQRYLSGPMGGDAQIADLVLERQCQKVIFFEDPHVARQHEADIQLLERAVRVVTREATCATSPAVANKWASAVALRNLR
jgi:methylglyoxal synthase